MTNKNTWMETGNEYRYVSPQGEILATITHNQFKGIYWNVRSGKGYVTLEQAKAAVEGSLK